MKARGPGCFDDDYYNAENADLNDLREQAAASRLSSPGPTFWSMADMRADTIASSLYV